MSDSDAHLDHDVRAACRVFPEEQSNGEPAVPIRVCVIDLGTNSFHAVLVEAHPNGTFEVIDKIKEMVQLGEGGLTEHRLTEEAMARGLDALQRIQLLAEGWEVTEYLAYATSAIREAQNGGDFIQRVQKQVGLRIRPISGALEAELIYRGVRRAVDMPRPALVVDIGGGSTECIVHDGRQSVFQASLKIGAARMTERFITTDPVTSEEFRPLRSYYRSMLPPVFEAARQHGVKEIVGSSGTMENLAQVCTDLQGTGDRSIFQQAFEAGAFREATKRIMSSTREEREGMSGIDAKRVGQIVAGAMLADVIVKDLGIEQLRISSHALREGIVEHYIAENYERIERLAPFASVRRRSVYEMAYQFRWEEGHARHVTALALQLFDSCRSLHGLGKRERELLEYAALLHDIGYTISRRKHHKHARYLIKHADLRGFLDEEIHTMAHVARYHRRALPKKKHGSFMKLSEAHRLRIKQLAAFLRLAEGLDRSHFQNVTHMRTELNEKQFRILLETKGDPQLEIWGAKRGSDLFERVYSREVVIQAAVPDEEASA